MEQIKVSPTIITNIHSIFCSEWLYSSNLEADFNMFPVNCAHLAGTCIERVSTTFCVHKRSHSLSISVFLHLCPLCPLCPRVYLLAHGLFRDLGLCSGEQSVDKCLFMCGEPPFCLLSLPYLAALPGVPICAGFRFNNRALYSASYWHV